MAEYKITLGLSPQVFQHIEMKNSEFTSSIIADILLTLITCGIYYFFIQNRQIKALNQMLKRPKYSFGAWLFFSIITCGIYHIYHEYIMAQDINEASGNKNPNLPVISLLLTIMALPIVADAIMQSEINKYFENEKA